MKPKKQCNHAGCKTLVDFNIEHCKKHKLIHAEKAKNKHSDSYQYRKEKYGKYHEFYKTTRWRKMSRLHKIKNPLCEMCLKEDLIVEVDVADHIIEIRDDWSKRYDDSNLMSLCHSCHNSKSKREREKRYKG